MWQFQVQSGFVPRGAGEPYKEGISTRMAHPRCLIILITTTAGMHQQAERTKLLVDSRVP